MEPRCTVPAEVNIERRVACVKYLDIDDHIIKDVLAFGQFGIPAAATMPSVDAPHPLHPQVNFLFQVRAQLML